MRITTEAAILNENMTFKKSITEFLIRQKLKNDNEKFTYQGGL